MFRRYYRRPLAKSDKRHSVVEIPSTIQFPFAMAKRKTSIALNPREVERFREAADVRGLSLSEFMSQSTANALDTADATVVLKSFAADLRADITRLMERLLESDVLQAQERSRFLDEQRSVLGNFLEGLKASQREAVKDAFQFGQKHPTTPKPSDQELGIHRPPTPRS